MNEINEKDGLIFPILDAYFLGDRLPEAIASATQRNDIAFFAHPAFMSTLLVG